MTARPLDAVPYAEGITDADLRLLGPVDGRRVLVLGARDVTAAERFSAEGAHVMLVEPDALRRSRAEAQASAAPIEWHDADFAELAFIRADTVDLAFSAGALDEVGDLPRVLRQVHRVLRAGGTLIMAFDHPATSTIVDGRVVRTWGDPSATKTSRDGAEVEIHPHSIASVFVHLVRSGFRVDALAEPCGPDVLPRAIVFRARKEGI